MPQVHGPDPDSAAKQSLLLGPLLMSASALTQAILASIIKWASHGFSTEFLLAIRFWMSLLFFLVTQPRAFKRDLADCLRPSLLSVQGLCYAAGVFLLYLSVRYVHLVVAVLLINTSPIFAHVFSWLIYRKRESLVVWLGLFIGMAGVIVVVKPGAEGFQPAALLGLAAGVLLGLQMAISAELLKRESKHRIAMSAQVYGVIVASIAALIVGVEPTDWQKVLFPYPDWGKPWLEYPGLILALLVMGLFSALTPLFTTHAYKFGSVGQVTPFRFTGIIFAGFIGWLIWGTVPALTTLLGFVLIVAGGVCAVLGGRTRHPHETSHT